MSDQQSPSNPDPDADKAQSVRRELSGSLKLAVEFGPLLAFFGAFQIWGLIPATAVFMAATAVAVAFSWIKTRHVAPMLWINFALISVMGGLTLYLNDETFVKMKPTLLFSFFAVALLGAERFDRLILKSLLGGSMPPVPDPVWRKLTWGLAATYLLFALANEWVWRSFSTETWVTVKVFVVMPALVVISLVLVMIFFMPYLKDAEAKQKSETADPED